MIQVIAILVSIGAFAWSFFQPVWAWVPLIVVALYLLFVLLSLKFEKYNSVKELSPSANQMFQKYAHFYLKPFAGRDFSSACSTIQFGAVAVGLVGAFNGFL